MKACRCWFNFYGRKVNLKNIVKEITNGFNILGFSWFVFLLFVGAVIFDFGLKFYPWITGLLFPLFFFGWVTLLFLSQLVIVYVIAKILGKKERNKGA